MFTIDQPYLVTLKLIFSNLPNSWVERKNFFAKYDNEISSRWKWKWPKLQKYNVEKFFVNNKILSFQNKIQYRINFLHGLVSKIQFCVQFTFMSEVFSAVKISSLDSIFSKNVILKIGHTKKILSQNFCWLPGLWF